eukprot:gb/GEZN01014068.1/.p1 GENE.gb/GEZN01014068.1/~~gb/GEZN01014068.1/.p1  ORF type:complete len:188 (-),score=36.36 gb/GEZN01014068.1/:341-904(-)
MSSKGKATTSMAGTRPDNVNADDWSAMQNALGSVTKNSKGISPQQLQNAKDEDLGNNPEIEEAWAEKAGKHAETYHKVLKVMKDKKKVKLTKIDDQIYTHFRKEFPKLKVEHLDYKKDLQGIKSKTQWKKFSEVYKDSYVQDYNFGTLIRLNVKEELGAENSAIVYRVQFHAIEIARNREGHNDHIR